MLKNLTYFLAEFNDRIIIVANGKFPKDREILDYIQKSRLIIACDGAISRLNHAGIIADYVIGDGDSANRIAQGTARNPYITIPDQNTNDLTKAVNFIKETQTTDNSVVIIGASGLREDHALANIALLEQYRTNFPKIAMLSDYGILQAFPPGVHHLKTVTGQQISFFSLSGNAKVSCEELKWPLKEQSFDFLNSGTLNQATTNGINFSCDQSLLVYRAFEQKC